jgi:hypothetical protein
MTRKNSNQKGGLTTDIDFKKAFYYFITNSSFNFVNNGSNGIIIKANLKPNIVNTPYYSFRTKNYGEPVRQLIFKIVLIHDDVNYNSDFLNYGLTWDFFNKTINFTNPRRFKEEVLIQSDITIETMSHLEPSCPIIVYSDIYENDYSINLIELIKHKLEDPRQLFIFNKIIEALKTTLYKNTIESGTPVSIPYKNKSKMGIIAMELITDNFITMNDYFNKNIISLFKKYDNLLKENEKEAIQKINEEPEFIKFTLYKNMARLAILSIAVNSGYSQGDYHFGNILIDPNYEGYYMQSKFLNFPDIEMNDNTSNNNNILNSVFNVDINSSKIKTPYESLKDDVVNDKGKILIIDFGYSNSIKDSHLKKMRENIEYILNNINTISMDEFKKKINECIKIVFITPRNDNTLMNQYHKLYYGWFLGKYICSTCSEETYYKEEGLIERDYKQLLLLLKMRNNSIEYLINRSLTGSIPFNIPLDEETILKKSFNALKKFPISDIESDNEKIIENNIVGGNSSQNNLIGKCFRSIGFGLKSLEYLYDNNQTPKNISKNNKTPYKILDTSHNYKAINVGVGGKNKRKTLKKIKNKK